MRCWRAGWRACAGPCRVVIATHEPADIPATATHALVLREGRVVYRGRIRAAAQRSLGQAGTAPAALRGQPRRQGRRPGRGRRAAGAP